MAMAWVVPHSDNWMAARRKPPDPRDVEIGRRLRRAREALRRTQLEVATELGISEATYGRREAGLIKLSASALDRTARVLGLAPDAMLPGAPEPRPVGPRPPLAILRELEASIAHHTNGPAVGEPLTTVPVRVIRDAASVGSARTHADGDELPYPVRPDEIGHHLVGVEVRGDCLEPSGILSGQVAIVDLSVRPRLGDIVLARRDDELLVKRLVLDGNLRYLEADQHWQPLLVADGVDLLGVCVAFMTRPPRPRQ